MRICHDLGGCDRPIHARGLCGMHYKREYQAGYRSPNDSTVRAKHQAKLRMQAIQLLGGVCIRCGFSDVRALQFDHSYGDRTTVSDTSWSRKYKEILKFGSLRFQLLCANCNWIKRHEMKEAIGRPRTAIRAASVIIT